MDVQECNKGTCPNNPMHVAVQSSSLSGLKTKEHHTLGDVHAPKVRKPYTITKQREKWNEEEHKKFLEALQLYGRAWRRVEEHIGTKTAVQIRSHAQKFFSKVVGESTSNSKGTVKAVEIPPPRPKRKPVHPYPRKMGNHPIDVEQTIGKLDRCPSSKPENGSPISVLSAFGSENMNCCTSPVTSAAGSNEHETSTEELEQKQKHSPMGLDLRCGVRSTSKEPSSSDAPVPSLKLFGKTVFVTDTRNPSSSNVANSKSLPIADIESQDKDTCMETIGSQSVPFLQGAFHNEILPTSYPMPLNYGDNIYSWWALFGNLPLSFLHQQNLNPSPSDKVVKKESTRTGSNTVRTQCTNRGRSVENGDNVSGLDKSVRGFVPYKRSGVERGEHPREMSDGGKGESIALRL